MDCVFLKKSSCCVFFHFHSDLVCIFQKFFAFYFLTKSQFVFLIRDSELLLLHLRCDAFFALTFIFSSRIFLGNALLFTACRETGSKMKYCQARYSQSHVFLGVHVPDHFF